MEYPADTLGADERALLAPHVTNLDRPVFALVGLPETVKGALFARYSRYPGTLRRLMIDEFADDLAAAGGTATAPGGGSRDSGRAAQLYERIFLGYGDDSVAQLGGAHWRASGSPTSSRRSSSARGWPPTSSSRRGTSPTTRRSTASRYRYYRDPVLGPEYEAAMDALFGELRRGAPGRERLGGAGVPGRRWRVPGGARARGQGQGA